MSLESHNDLANDNYKCFIFLVQLLLWRYRSSCCLDVFDAAIQSVRLISCLWQQDHTWWLLPLCTGHR